MLAPHRPLTCLAVDDEPMALELLAEYIAKVSDLRLSGAYRDAIRALQVLQDQPVDLLFLDISMPDLSGIQLLKTLRQRPLVIFTTAHSQYAVESYEYAAVDYLLKPIEFPRFLAAVRKACCALAPSEPAAARPGETIGPAAVYVKSGTDLHRLDPAEILYVEGAGNYVQFVTGAKRVLALMSMAEALTLLRRHGFVRVHKSFIVAVRHLETISPDAVLVYGKRIPIGDKYRVELESFLPRP